MALKEQVGDGNGRIKLTRTGATCHREFLGLWSDTAPVIGTPHPTFPYLLVDSVELVPEGAPMGTSDGVGTTENLRILVDYVYNYQRPKLGDPPRVNYEVVSEALLTGAGRVWDDCGEVVEAEDFSTATMYTQIRVTVDMAVDTLPLATVRALVNKVNDIAWQGAPAGCMLFESASAQAEFDWDTAVWYFRVQYTFLERDHPHNEIWRGPIPMRDSAGNIMYYQGKTQYLDPPTNAEPDPTYTATATLVGHPMPKAGTPGAAAWTTTTPKIYEDGDFTVLGLD
jgi:hypothetical protein